MAKKYRSFASTQAGQTNIARKELEYIVRDLNKIFAFQSIAIVDLDLDESLHVLNRRFLFNLILGISGKHLHINMAQLPEKNVKSNRAIFINLASTITTFATTHVLATGPHYGSGDEQKFQA